MSIQCIILVGVSALVMILAPIIGTLTKDANNETQFQANAIWLMLFAILVK